MKNFRFLMRLEGGVLGFCILVPAFQGENPIVPALVLCGLVWVIFRVILSRAQSRVGGGL